MQFITSGNRIAVENFVLGDFYTITFTNGTYINSACIGIGDNFVTFQRNEPELLFTLTMATAELVSSIELYSGGTGTNSYNDLTNKPQINDVELVGNKSLSDLGIQSTISDIDTIRSGAAAGATAVQPAALADYQTVIDSSHKLDADLVDDISSTHKFATAAQLSQIGINENNILSVQNQMQIENEFDGTTYGTGYYSNSGNLVQNASFKHTFISCAPNDIIRFNLQSEALTGQYGGLWLDNTFVRAINGLQTNQGDYYEFTVPSGVNKVCINFTTPSTLVISKNVPWLYNAAHTDIYMRNLDITNNLKNANVSFKNDVSYANIFRKVCCIGDSLTAGEYGSDGTISYGIYADYSYPAFLAKQIDANVQNLGIGGQSTKTWYENYSQTFTPEQKDWTGYDAFIIFLGTNGGVDGNIDSSDDSMMGYYCKIIEMILTANSQASIFICTSPWTSSRDLKPNFTTQILALGEHYSLPVLRLDQSKILTYEQRFINQPYDNLIHYGRTGYMRLASEIVRCINDVTPTYFNKLYGTHT